MERYILENTANRPITINIPGTYINITLKPGQKKVVTKLSKNRVEVYKALRSEGIKFYKEVV